MRERFFRKAASYLSYRNYHIAKWRHRRNLLKRELAYNKPPLLVYQVGKVGSLTVAETLKNQNLDRLVYHFHVLRPERIKVYENWGKSFFPDIHTGKLKATWQCQHIYNRIKKGGKTGKWDIVTLVRDPIARSMAQFFENLQVKPSAAPSGYNIVSKWYGFEFPVADDTVERLIDIYLRRIDHERPLRYFDLEFKGVLGVDLYDHPFCRSSGYQIYDIDHFNILLIKLEHLNRCYTEAFRHFLGIDIKNLSHTNHGENKQTADYYLSFKKNVVFPKSYLDTVYNSKFTQKFYADSEIDQFRQRWQSA